MTELRFPDVTTGQDNHEGHSVDVRVIIGGDPNNPPDGNPRWLVSDGGEPVSATGDLIPRELTNWLDTGQYELSDRKGRNDDYPFNTKQAGIDSKGGVHSIIGQMRGEIAIEFLRRGGASAIVRLLKLTMFARYTTRDHFSGRARVCTGVGAPYWLEDWYYQWTMDFRWEAVFWVTIGRRSFSRTRRGSDYMVIDSRRFRYHRPMIWYDVLRYCRVRNPEVPDRMPVSPNPPAWNLRMNPDGSRPWDFQRSSRAGHLDSRHMNRHQSDHLGNGLGVHGVGAPGLTVSAGTATGHATGVRPGIEFGAAILYPSFMVPVGQATPGLQMPTSIQGRAANQPLDR